MSIAKGEINKKENESKLISEEQCVKRWGYRHQQCFVLFLYLTVAYSMRTCIGVSLVAMTVHNYNEIDNIALKKIKVDINNTKINEQDEFKVEGILNALMLIPPYPKFKWNKRIQDSVTSSFFWGYMATQIPAGHLAYKFGAKFLLMGAMIINCLVSIFLPLAACYGGWITMMICRMLQGLSQACVIPGMHTLFGKWAPLQERGRMTAFAYGGSALGTVLGLPITGFIASSSLGWPGIFRFYGLLCGIIGGVLWWLAADSPAEHPKISEAEKRYIEHDLGQKQGAVQKKIKVPWLKILSHPGMYAIIAGHIGQAWTTLTLFSEIPAFMDKIMKVNIKANGLLTALPYLVMWFTNFFFCWLSDFIVVKKILSVANTRKLFNCLGTIPAGIGLIVLAFAPKTIYIVETILIITCSFSVATHLGFQVNHIDISPNFAGIMMSLSNFASNAMASLAPIIASVILTDVTNEHLWRQVFFVSAGFYFCSNLIYVVFGTADVAEWNDLPEEKSHIDNEKESQPLFKENISSV